MTYLVMSLPFVGAAFIVFTVGVAHAGRRGTVGRYFSSWAVTTAALMVLTAVFDNVMMAAGFFDYGADEISGIRFGLMPVEDFLYPIAGALLIAGVWQLFGGAQERRAGTDV
ncbi:lycopene cyclase domain-containing protein [Microbacterium sp. A93]|uniref:lycopene cyclase domain-containing protein n=1 Tax=unclassified Microbacterium TaxID=2609290 RepID=UPI003F43289E